MNEKFERLKPLVTWGGKVKRLNWLVVTALLLSLLMPMAAPQTQSAAHIQPLLVQMAAEHPDQVVSVIVQKTAQDTHVEDSISALSGKVTTDLHIINALAAEMTVQAAVQLAKTDGVRWVSLDAPVASSGGPDGTISTTALLNVYDKAVGADKLWAEGYQGSSVTVAYVDSGWTGHDDFTATPSGGSMRLLKRVGFNGNETNLDDHMAHGDVIAGVIGGNGRVSKGKYIGVAPKVKLVSVKVSDSSGASNMSGVIAGLQWILANKDTYNIRVVNISLNSETAESYLTNPLDAAVEILWFNKIVVVVSAGNNGGTASGILYPPANDPFVITVGAVDDKGTVSTSDDVLAPFSAFGTTFGGFSKPDLVAPGKNIVGPLASGGAELSKAHPLNRVDGKTDYFRISGTSMSAPIVSGAVALLIQSNPNLTPDQIKYRLKATARPFIGGNGAGYLDIYAAVHDATAQSANTGTVVSDLLNTGPDGVLSSAVQWSSVQWSSVQWSSVQWSSVQWSSVQWSSVQWSSDYWGP